MTHKKSDKLQQKQQQQSKNDQKQDIKNAEYMAHINQPNHPNT